MCKVAGITGINDSNRKLAWEFMIKLGAMMTYGNNHGLGYAAFDKDNNIFGEKWLYNREAFLLPNDRSINGLRPKDYQSFGPEVKRNEARGIILHTRMATCARNIENTHPFVDNFDNPNFALIHNGVITNDHKLTKVHSTCDSEVILHEYIKHNCRGDLKNIQKVADNLVGWYTCFVLAKDENGNPVMDIFTENGRLNSYYVEELGCRVYSTSDMDMQRVARFFGFTLRKRIKFKSDTMRRLNFDTGEIIFKGDFKSYIETYTSRGRYGKHWFMDMVDDIEKNNKEHKIKVK